MSAYPDVILFKDIHKGKNICCTCGKEIHASGCAGIVRVGRGKYLCPDCEAKVEKVPSDAETP